MPNRKFVEAVAKSTGRKQVIPAHWVDHPVLGADFKVSEPKAAVATRAPASAQKNDKES